MASLTNAAREAAALAITALGDRISLHTADPGTTGANEASGGSYARQQTTWTGGSSDGSVPGSQVAIPANPGTYSHYGVWSSGGTFIGGTALSSAATLGSAGQVLVTPSASVAPAP
jgi:hypothetical protein